MGRARAALILAASALFFARPATAETGSGVFGLLEPGSRPATALGGDPFLSPLDDRCGWWSRLDAGTGRIARVEAEAADPVTRRASRDRGDLSSRRLSWEAVTGGSWGDRRWLVAGRVTDRRWTGSWDGASGGVALGGAGTRLDLAARLEDVVDGVTLQAAGPLGGGSGEIARSSLGAVVRYRPGARIAVQCRWEQRRHPEILESGFYGEPWSASVNLRSDLVRVDGRLVLPRGLRWEGSVSRAWHSEDEARGAPGRYALSPGGAVRTDEMSLTWAAPWIGTVLARRAAVNADVEGDATYGGERFGRLSYARGDLESYLLAVQPVSSRTWRAFAEAEVVQLEGEARAKVETWPFTPTLVDLLGHRRIYEAEGSARWTRWHAAAERRIGARLRAQCGASWYDIRPRLVVDSWRPAFLVFGRSDFQRDELGTRRVRLAAVSAGGSYAAGGWAVEFAVQQFVFARTDTDHGRDEGGDDGGPAGGVARDGRGGFGGTRVIVRMTRGF
jgi:hypothetical protein